MYTILGKFEQEGYIEEVSVEGRKRTYQITSRGMIAYRDEVERLQRCVADATAEMTARLYSAETMGQGRGLQVCPC